MQYKALIFTIFSFFVIKGDTGFQVDDLETDPEVELPPDVIICKRNLPTKELNKCIKDSITSLLPKLKDGFPSLGLPPLDPYYLNETNNELQLLSLVIKLQLKEASLKGLSNGTVHNVDSKIDDKNFYLKINVSYSEIITTIKYMGQVSYHDLLLERKMNYFVTISDCFVTFELLGDLEKLGAEEYMVMKSLDVNFTEGNFKVNATGFLTDPGVNELASEIFNRHWKLLYNEWYYQTKTFWEPVYLDLVNSIFARVPFRKLMPKE